ncbi:uncharacterized protein [Procambarus clarkii]|uniref:uncharacterized protein n=1 Tax=Procambarus clarkii TaxID=6728 RepID=UPI0037425B7C
MANFVETDSPLPTPRFCRKVYRSLTNDSKRLSEGKNTPQFVRQYCVRRKTNNHADEIVNGGSAGGNSECRTKKTFKGESDDNIIATSYRVINTSPRPSKDIDDTSSSSRASKYIDDTGTSSRASKYIDDTGTSSRASKYIDDTGTSSRASKYIDDTGTSSRASKYIDDTGTSSRASKYIDDTGTSSRASKYIDDTSTSSRASKYIDDTGTSSRASKYIDDTGTSSRASKCIDDTGTSSRASKYIDDTGTSSRASKYIDDTGTSSRASKYLVAPGTSSRASKHIDDTNASSRASKHIDDTNTSSRASKHIDDTNASSRASKHIDDTSLSSRIPTFTVISPKSSYNTSGKNESDYINKLDDTFNSAAQSYNSVHKVQEIYRKTSTNIISNNMQKPKHNEVKSSSSYKASPVQFKSRLPSERAEREVSAPKPYTTRTGESSEDSEDDMGGHDNVVAISYKQYDLSGKCWQFMAGKTDAVKPTQECNKNTISMENFANAKRDSEMKMETSVSMTNNESKSEEQFQNYNNHQSCLTDGISDRLETLNGKVTKDAVRFLACPSETKSQNKDSELKITHNISKDLDCRYLPFLKEELSRSERKMPCTPEHNVAILRHGSLPTRFGKRGSYIWGIVKEFVSTLPSDVSKGLECDTKTQSSLPTTVRHNLDDVHLRKTDDSVRKKILQKVYDKFDSIKDSETVLPNKLDLPNKRGSLDTQESSRLRLSKTGKIEVIDASMTDEDSEQINEEGQDDILQDNDKQQAVQYRRDSKAKQKKTA